VPDPYYYAIIDAFASLVQLLNAHQVSMSLLQFQVTLFKLSSDRGHLQEFAHEKSSLKKNPLRPYCARIVQQ
jgi:hypothetical protein